VRRILLLGFLLATACGRGAPTEDSLPSEPLVFIAVGEAALALLDISPRIEPGRYQHLVAPGATMPVSDVAGYDPALGIGFLIYRVDPATGIAHYARTHLATAPAINAGGRVVKITTFES
jgi:hypothetical protein